MNKEDIIEKIKELTDYIEKHGSLRQTHQYLVLFGSISNSIEQMSLLELDYFEKLLNDLKGSEYRLENSVLNNMINSLISRKVKIYKKDLKELEKLLKKFK